MENILAKHKKLHKPYLLKICSAKKRGDFYLVSTFAWFQLLISEVHLLRAERTNSISIVAHTCPSQKRQLRAKQPNYKINPSIKHTLRFISNSGQIIRNQTPFYWPNIHAYITQKKNKNPSTAIFLISNLTLQ